MKRSIEELEKFLATEGETLKRAIALLELNKAIRLTDFPRSSAICQEAVELTSKLGDRTLEARAHIGLGNARWKMGQMEESQESYLKGLELSRQAGYSSGLVDAYCGLGIVHGALEDFANALEYFEKGAKEAERVDNEEMLAHCLGNIGHVYHSMDDYVSALKYFAKALSINRELGEEGLVGVSNMLGAIAGVLVFQKEFDKALEHLEECLVIDEKTGNLRGKVVVLFNMGITYFEWGKYSEAIVYLKRSLAVAESIHFGLQLPDIHQQLSKVYEAMGDTEDAIHHLRRYQEFRKDEKRMRVHLNVSKAG